ncbi:MAG: HAMP domain-containing histidine kinase [Ruminococcus sp.]|nr:HAMP domain-containing histidine kinase [Ruminococcus sp.]
MKKKLFGAALLFAALLSALTAVFAFSGSNSSQTDERAEAVVDLAEIDSLYRSGRTEEAARRSEELRERLRSEPRSSGSSGRRIYVMYGISLGMIAAVFLYVYYSILRPFDRLGRFADEIARGNFDVPLDYERTNYFGSFTWAFDSMRREVTKARSCEKEAIENNKTVIASLSHDIKTPIASIRAYAEGLEANLDTTPEKRRKYLEVIMRKCDEVSKLTNDLFLHSLSDLDKLKITEERFELCGFVEEAVREIGAEQGDINFIPCGREIYISGDRSRLLQLCENLINNARKYAKTSVDVSITAEEGSAVLTFRDHGKGIPDEDIPFIFDKFYRGHNSQGEQGSGLGLYIVRYIAQRHGGSVSLRSCPDGGLEVRVVLPAETEEHNGE